MVGTAVYQFAWYVVKSSQNSVAENFGGTITDPPEPSGARKPANSPWTWKRGMTRYVLSFLLSLYVASTFCIVLVRLAWVSGTAFGLPVVPEVCSTRATSSGRA